MNVSIAASEKTFCLFYKFFTESAGEDSILWS